MRTRSIGLSLFATAAIVVAACTGGGTPAPATPAPVTPAPGTPAPATPEPKVWKIGVVTDVGTLDDKNFNQFSWEGAQKGAAAIGGEATAIVTVASADYDKNIQSFVDQEFDIIVTIGFALADATAKAAKVNKDTQFIGVDQAPCLTAAGDPDPTFTDCSGDMATLLPNFQGLVFAEQEPGYLAGIAAASITTKKVIGAIGGAAFIPPVVRYIKGYINGAHSVDPTIQVKVAYVSDDLGKAFNDPAGGKAFATQFIQQNGVDVLFQVAGKTGNGVLAAACDANIYGVGVDVDQHESTPETAKCTVTSAEKKLSIAVEQAIMRVGDGSAKGGVIGNDAKNDGIGLSKYYEFESMFSSDAQAKIQAAFDGFKAGTTDPCAPANCTDPFE